MPAGSILIVDADEHARASVVALVRRLGYQGIGAADVDSALVEIERSEPALIVLDLETGGLEVCRELLDLLHGRVPVILVSAERTDPADHVAGLLVGADDYLAKPFDAGELLARVRRSLERGVAPARQGATANPLTRREREVLALLGHESNKQIAHELAISTKTVSTHVQHILTKLGVHTRTQAVAYAITHGLDGEPASPVSVTG